jgi:hypothetical protein
MEMSLGRWPLEIITDYFGDVYKILIDMKYRPYRVLSHGRGHSVRRYHGLQSSDQSP